MKTQSIARSVAAAGLALVVGLSAQTALVQATAAPDPIVGGWLARGADPASASLMSFRPDGSVLVMRFSEPTSPATGTWTRTRENDYALSIESLSSTQAGDPSVVKSRLGIRYDPVSRSFVTTEHYMQTLDLSLNLVGGKAGPELRASPV